MDKGRITFNAYNGNRGQYFISHLNNKIYFVVVKGNAKIIQKVNIKTEKEYFVYDGEYKIVGDCIFIGN